MILHVAEAHTRIYAVLSSPSQRTSLDGSPFIQFNSPACVRACSHISLPTAPIHLLTNLTLSFITDITVPDLASRQIFDIFISFSLRIMGRQGYLVVVVAVVLRLVLFAAFPSLPDLLTNRVEISTPVTSFKRLQEGLFLYTHGVSPYDGGVFHQVIISLSLSLVAALNCVR